MTVRTERLPDALRRRLERSFGADLSSVRVHRCGTARRITEDLGTIACAVDGAILLGAQVTDAVLAHEVVHLLQARLPGAPSVFAAEDEAHRLAPRALAGLPCRVAVPADAAQPLCWEEAGHYYTVYYVGLACGLPDNDAMRIAFWTQFPDEVSELDAVKAGFDLPRSAGSDFVDWVSSGFGIPAAFQDMYVEINNGISNIYGGYGRMAPVPHRIQKDLQLNLDVQKGLHCLTGADCKIESRRREEISQKASLDDGFFEFGMSLHCFGDSFAHRDHDSGKMYPPAVGHGPETFIVQHAGDEAKALGMHHPDGLTPNRAKEFEEYVTRLHRLITFRFGKMSGGAVQSAPQTAATLRSVLAENPDPNNQCLRIRMLASRHLNVQMNPYTPEAQEDVYFAHFADQPKPVAVSRHHVDRGLQLARLWAMG